MCGITGIYAFNESGRFHLINLQKSIDKLSHRGPDAQGSHFDNRVGLGHRRLAVIDTSKEANQPMTDSTGRYVLVYNGEIYNYLDLRKELEKKFDVRFRTQSDTEVLLYACIHYGDSCLEKLNGFFAFAFYDKKTKELFGARDRFGIKPLFYYLDEDKILFGSELKSVISYGINKRINYDSLLLYLQLNYIPAPYTILEKVHKLLPGHYFKVKGKEFILKRYYSISGEIDYRGGNYDDIKQIILDKIDRSVRHRLVADVPLGVFLSGGIDSSIIAALAKRYRNDLSTFSIGYKGNSYFDESNYAEKVSKYLGTQHHTFHVGREEMVSRFHEILDHLDEPFADSSSIPVYMLSRYTRRHVTVALSGDGADEIFSGYNKHLAFYRARQRNLPNTFIKGLHPVWKRMPQSRNHFIADKFRQLNRYAYGLKLAAPERYWFWASFAPQQQALSWIHENNLPDIALNVLSEYKGEITSGIPDNYSMNDILSVDTRFILPNDMLYKVDLMSMAHGLEVRVPFLDHRLVEMAFGIPSRYKMNNRRQKILLRDILKDLLPGKLHKRRKHGFEVPLLDWFRKEMRHEIESNYLSDDLIEHQQIFHPPSIKKLKKQLFSASPGDSPAHVWALIVFQSWWEKYFD